MMNIYKLTQKKRSWTILIFILPLVLLVGCSGDKSTTDAPDAPSEEIDAETLVEESEQLEEPEARRGGGGTLSLFYHQAPTIVNPHLSQGNKDLNASSIVYEPLASFDKDGDMIPFLAAEIPSIENGGVAPDRTSVTWKLKEGVMWSDGEPFTADDVLFTFEYIANPNMKSTSAGAYSSVKSVEVIDDTTVKINFKEPTATWFLPFVGPQGMVIPRHVFEDYKGVVFTGYLEMVEDRYSPDVADTIIEACDLVSGGAYTTIGTYDHDELLQLVTHLSEETDFPVPELVRTFGVYLFSRFNINYPQFFEGVHKTFKFLERIEGYIHVEVRILYPDAELPRFEYPLSTEDQLVMIYISTRPFADLAEGLITGCIEHFGEKIDIQRENLAEDGTPARFTVTKQG